MNTTTSNTFLVRKVLNHILHAYPEKSGSTEATQKSLTEALVSLKPFSPPSQDSKVINAILLQNKASDLACKSAWALYKDFVVNDENVA